MKNFHRIKLSLVASLLCSSAMATIDVQQSILNMKVNSDGIHRVTYEDILAMNIDLSGVSNNQIAVFNNGDVIATKVFSEVGNRFGAGSYIEYIGFSDNNLYQKGSVYSLVLTQGKSIENVEVEFNREQEPEAFYLQTDYYNENTEYSFGAPIDDPWFYSRILAIGSPATETIGFELDNLVRQGEVNLELTIWGGTDYLQSPDHHVIYDLNGTNLDDFWFDGITSDIRNYTLRAESLFSGSHELAITLPQDTGTAADVIHVDSWKVSYPREFVLRDKQIDYPYNQSVDSQSSDNVFSNGFETEVINFAMQNANNENYSVYKILEDGATQSFASNNRGSCDENESQDCYLLFATQATDGYVFISADSQLKKPELTLPTILTDIKDLGTTDYLIISHPDFIGDELNQFAREKSEGFRVNIVDVEQIYAQFGFNNISADSIAQYIKYAINNFSVSNVLLVGGDTYDYKNYLGLNSVSFIPTMYIQSDSLITFAPADAKYVDINDDDIPDVNIGRFPVRTTAELVNLVEKIRNYTNKSYAQTTVFAADRFDASNGYSFKEDAEYLIGTLPQSWKDNMNSDNRAFYDDDGLSGVKTKITNQINSGVALTSFIGHSGPRDWSFSRMFSASDALTLTNSESPTLVTQWGCWNTYFVSPQEDTMAHAFMLNQNGGAASVLGASTLTKAEHERGLAELVLTNLTHHQMTLGDAVTQAKRAYSQINPDAKDVILGWNILGDPALKL